VRQRDRNSAVAGATALALSVLAIGGAPRWAVVMLACLAAAGVAAQLRSRRRFERLSPTLAVLGIATVLTALQCIPLPAGVLAALNPTAYELIVDGARLAGDPPPSFLPLSLDPPTSRRILLELATYVALAWIALRLAVSEPGRRRAAAAIVVVISGAALLALAHELASATRLYGLYTPQHAGRPLIMGPILNPNSFGSLLAMGAVLAGGLAMHGEQPLRQRLFWAALGGLSLVVALLTQSRGAAVALGVGLTVFGAIVALQRWRADGIRRPDLLRVTVPAVFVVLSVLALVVYMSAGGVHAQLDRTSASELTERGSKYAAWLSAGDLIVESPWIGVGRGGFEPTFSRVHADSALNTFSHVENAYLQTVIDWGIPGALAIAMALAWTVLAAARRASGGPLAAGALGALAAIAAQSVVDLGLELPGVAVPVIAIASIVTYVPVVEMRGPTLRNHTILRAVAIAGLLGLAALVALPVGRTLRDDHVALRTLTLPSLPLAQRQMRRHPMDYVGYAEAARVHLRAGKPSEGTRLLNHALRLHPTHPDLHMWAAQALVLGGKPLQARLEYMRAIRGRRNPTALVKEVAAVYKSAEDAASALPTNDENGLRIAQVLIDLDRRDVALHYLSHLAEANPLDAKVHELLTKVASELKDDGVAEAAARRRAELSPTLAARLAYATILYHRGKLREAETALHGVERAGGGADDQVTARLLLCDVQRDLKDLPRARDCLRSLIDLPAVRARTRREIHRRLAKIEDALGNPRRADWERRQAER
jgi:O-antigen ligase